VLTEVVRAIAELDVRQSAGELGSLFSRTSPAVRGEILRAVTRMGAPRGFESLVRMGMRDPDRDVRSQAAKALGSWQASQEGD
jgi:HEAT repeat protein